MTLHDAIDKDFFIIDETRYSDTEIQKMTLDDLETLKMRINKKISGLSASIKEKQIDYANSGRRASKDWYLNRKLALSINQRVLMYVNYLLKKRSKEASQGLGDYFMGQAKIILKKNDYELILSNAYREKECAERGDVAI